MNARKANWSRVVALTERALTVVVVLAVLAGCGPTPPPATVAPAETPTETGPTTLETPAPTPTQVETEVPVSGGDLVVATWQRPETLNVAVSALAVVVELGTLWTDSLFYKQPGDDTLYPGLATSYEVSEDGKIIALHLREGVKFHDGTDFNAEALKRWFDYTVDPDTHAVLGLMPMSQYESSEVVDEYALDVHFKRPDPGGFMAYISTNFDAPQSVAAIEKWGVDYDFHLAGTGPFMLEEYVPGEYVRFVRNPDYNWAPEIFHQGPAYLDSMTFTILAEAASRVASLESGETRMIDGVPTEDLARLGQDPNYQTLSGYRMGLAHCWQLNCSLAPMDDPQVRLALQYATNQEQIADTLFQGTREPSHNVLQPTNFGYDASLNDMYSYDLEMAKQILEEAGWEEGPDGIRVKDGQRLHLIALVEAESTDDLAATTMLQEQWSQAGVEMEIVLQELTLYIDTCNSGKGYHLTPDFDWGSSTASTLEVFFHSKNINGYANWSQWRNTEVDGWIDEFMTTFDEQRQLELSSNIVKAVLEDSAIVPGFVGKNVVVATANVHGIRFDPSGYYLVNDAWLGE